MPTIVSRSEWGAKPWQTPVYHVEIAARDYFLNHYHGGKPLHDRGAAMAREIEAIHRAEGWAGVGYAFMVGQDGVAYEGRGWELVGAHCPDFNTRGVGVYYAVGGDQEPTEAAKATGRWLYEEHGRRRGSRPVMTYHGAHYATECAGKALIAWTQAGMPAKDLPVVKSPRVTTPKPAVKASIDVDGILGEQTIEALQDRLIRAGYKIDSDGDLGPNTTAALQRYLNAKLGGADLAVDGKGLGQGLAGSTKTIAALQRWLGTPVDGRLSLPTSAAVKRLQDRLNRGNF